MLAQTSGIGVLGVLAGGRLWVVMFAGAGMMNAVGVFGDEEPRSRQHSGKRIATELK